MVQDETAPAPVPAPATPAPRIPAPEGCANRDGCTESDKITDHRARRRSSINNSRIINRNIDDLWIRRLNYDDLLRSLRLLHNLQLRGGAQRSGRIRLRAQPLN